MSDAEIERLLDVAVLAPNHHLTEPWTFTVIRGAARERFGRRWGEIVAQGVGQDEPSRDARIEMEARKWSRAPAIIVASVRTDPDPVVAAEDFAATAAAVQNMLLAAVELKLGAIWRTGAMAYSPELKAALGLEPADRIAGIVYVGRAAAEPKPRPARRAAFRYLDEPGT